MSTPAQRWSASHHGIDPASVPLLRPWLRLVWWLARPLARVPPTVVTIAGVVLAGVAAWLADPWPWAALPCVLVAGFADSLDGAIAVLADRATRSGALADAIADRLSDIAFAVVLWRCGAPGWLAVLAGTLAVGVDALRRLRRRPAVITVGERPSWTICAALSCACAASSDARWPVLVCAGVWLVLGAAALAQLCSPLPPKRPGFPAVGRPFRG